MWERLHLGKQKKSVLSKAPDVIPVNQGNGNTAELGENHDINCQQSDAMNHAGSQGCTLASSGW